MAKSTSQKASAYLQHLAASLLWDCVLPRYFEQCVFILSNIQVIAILLQIRFTFLPTGEGLSKEIATITSFLTLQDFSTNQDSKTFTIVAVVLILLFLLIFILLFLRISYAYFSEKKISPEIKLSTITLNQFHLSYSFWIISAILISNLTVSVSDMDSYNAVIHIFSIILLLINYALGLFISLFSYNPFIGTDLFSGHSSRFQVLTFLTKAVLCLIFGFSGGSTSSNWALTVVAIVLLTIRHYDLLLNLPYYEYETTKIAIVLSSASLVTSLMNLMSLILKSIDKQDSDFTIYIELILTLVSAKLWVSYFERRVFKTFEVSQTTLKNQNQVIKQVMSLRYAAMNLNMPVNPASENANLKQLQFWALLTSNTTGKSSLDNFNLRDGTSLSDLNVKQVETLHSKFKREFLKNLLESAIEKFKHSDKLKILLLSKYIDDPSDIISPLSLFHSISKTESFLTNVIAIKLREKLQEKVFLFHDNKASVNKINIKSFIKFEKVSHEFLQMIHLNCQNQIAFWKTYSQPNIAIMNFYEKSRSFESTHNKISQYWTQKIENQKFFAGLLINAYHLYLTWVRNQPIFASKLLKKCLLFNSVENTHKGPESLFFNFSLNNFNTIIVHVSMSKERLGTIVHASPHAKEALGWISNDIERKRLSSLMPPFLREKQNELLQSHLQSIGTSDNVLPKTFDTFVFNEKGYVLPCQIYITIHPKIQSELVYVGAIKLKDKQENYILLSEDGYIEGFTPTIEAQLGLKFEKRHHMQEICKNYLDLKTAIELVSKDTTGKGPFLRSQSIFGNGNSNALDQEQTLLESLVLEISNQHDNSPQKTISYEARPQKQSFCNSSFYILKMKKIDKMSPSKDIKTQLSADLDPKNDYADSDVSSNRVPDEYVSPINSPTSKSLINPLITSFNYGSTRKLLEATTITRNFDTSSPKASLFRKTPLAYTTTRQDEMLQSETGGNQRDDEDQEIQVINHQILPDLDDSVSVFSGERYNAKIEEAVHTVPKNIRFRILKALGVLLIIGSPLILISFQSTNKTKLDLLDGNIQVLTQSKWMLAFIGLLIQETRLLALVDSGIVLPSRYGLQIPAAYLKYAIAEAVGEAAQKVYTWNNKVKIALDSIDAKLRNKIYHNKIAVYDYDGNDVFTYVHSSNIFDVISEIMARSIHLASTPIPQLTSQNPDMQFILKNIMNDLLLQGENIIPVLLEDSHDKLQKQISLVAILFAVMAVISLLTFRLLFKGVKSFLKQRDHFLSVLLRLEGEPIRARIEMLSRFSAVLERTNFTTKSQNFQLTKDCFQLLNSKSYHSKVIKRSGDMSRINKTIICITVGLVVFILLILMIYLAMFLLANFQKNSIYDKIELMTISDNYFYESHMLVALQYEYVATNGTSQVRGRSITEECTELFNSLTDAQAFFATSLSNKNSGIGASTDLTEIVQGHLCDMIEVPDELGSLCQTAKGGMLQKGIVGMTSMYLSIFQQVISTFNSSQRSTSDMAVALSITDLVSEESLVAFITPGAYTILNSLIQTKLKENLNNFNLIFKVLISVYGVCCVLIGVPIWLKAQGALEEEMNHWKKIMRQIPLEIVATNKFLKTFLINNYNNILQSHKEDF